MKDKSTNALRDSLLTAYEKKIDFLNSGLDV